MNSKICLPALSIACFTVSVHAAVLTVTTLADLGPGSLRDRITASAPGDTIQFAVTGKILLNSSITINHSLLIQGPGAGLLTVDAQHLDRAFIAAAVGTVYFTGMTISNGFVAGLDGPNASNPGQNGGPGLDALGGAILDYCDSLELSNCWVTGNSVQGGRGGFGGPNPVGAAFTTGKGGDGGQGLGGGIYATSSVFMVNCTFSANSAVAGTGGVGGTNFNAAVNESGGTGGTGGFGQGGAIDIVDTGQRQFQNSTFSGNVAGGGDGGAGGDSLNGSGGTGGNGGQAGGGAIASVVNDLFGLTIVSNNADGGSGGLAGNGTIPGTNGNSISGTGGGVTGYAFFCLSEIENTIIAENFANNGGVPNYYIGLYESYGFNFLGTFDPMFCSPLKPTSRAGTISIPLHPLLLPLAQNGGGTPTHATTLSSPVTDAGTAFPLPFDERGAPRPYDFPAIPNVDDGSDIGAFELGSADLGLGMISSNVVVSWPAYYGDFVLQSATNLQGSNIWRMVPDTPVQIGNQFVVTNHMTGAIKFFRLINQ
jgi:hypothetical protein